MTGKFNRNRQGKSFSAQVKEFADLGEANMLLVIKQSLQETIEEANQPTGKGGKMRVDTGFLRASGIGSVNNAPTGQSRPEGLDDPSFIAYDPKAYTGAIASLAIGDTFYYGWVAHYAQYREHYDGFLGSALQNWQQTVTRNAQKARDNINAQR